MTADVMRAKALLERIVTARPIWIGDDGRFRVAHTGDMVEMLERLGIATVS